LRLQEELKVLDTLELTENKSKISLKQYLSEEAVCFLSHSSKKQVLFELVDKLATLEKIKRKNAFLQAILKREDIVSTGIGVGVAIPHAKLMDLEDFFIILGVQKLKGIEWDSIDKSPVRFVFMIGGPENRQIEYLQILSKLTLIMRDETLRQKLLYFTSPKQVYEQLIAYDDNLL